MTVPAIVYPVSHPAGMSVIRGLQGRGIPLIALDYNPDAPGLRSKHVKPLIASYRNAAYLAGEVPMHERPVLFCVDDEDVFASLRESVWSTQYRLPSSGWDVMRPMVDKAEMYRRAEAAGFLTPKIYPTPQDAYCPVILKPTHSTEFRRRFGVKAKLFHSKYELAEFAAEVDETGIPYLIQQYIPGNMDQLYTYAAYSTYGGEVVSEFTGRKLHQVPPDFGTARLAESVDNPTVRHIGRQLLEHWGYRGISLTEFKRGPDGKFYLMEVNPRPGGWPERLAQACGANLVLNAYQEATELRPTPYRARGTGKKWINLPEDFHYATGGYKRMGYPQAHSGPFRWVRDILGTRVEAFWDWRDMGPFWTRLKAWLKQEKP